MSAASCSSLYITSDDPTIVRRFDANCSSYLTYQDHLFSVFLFPGNQSTVELSSITNTPHPMQPNRQLYCFLNNTSRIFRIKSGKGL